MALSEARASVDDLLLNSSVSTVRPATGRGARPDCLSLCSDGIQ